MKTLGLDIGSTTLKCVVTDENGKILYKTYARHRSDIARNTASLLSDAAERYGDEMLLAVTGSAGMGTANKFDIPFVQEVYSARTAVLRLCPDTDTVIELGGEDAKILFLTDGLEVRMNGTCAGGTGAFIDQMASLLGMSADEMDAAAAKSTRIYSIASRCGVFAKSDIQPLLNQGAPKEDVCASIFRAVVNQTIAGLAQGRSIKGKVLYLGGPLTFLPELRRSFDETLGLTGICPENSLYYVALGAAMSPMKKKYDIKALSEKISEASQGGVYSSCAPLFKNSAEYEAFTERHAAASKGIRELDKPSGVMYLGVDAGSTTVKAILCDSHGNVFRPFYRPNNGSPVPLVREYLEGIYRDYPDISIRSSAVTGYGEDIIKCAFRLDHGVVETVAHYTAAKKFRPDVDFILDIGGQDIKCFRIRNGAIDSIYLNEACSSGCGSFLQTFAAVSGYTPAQFARIALFAPAPVDLGSRCTVFMNSSVKQAQKDGASVGCISAGLAVSVVKNALYKVIRCASADQLGQNIVVQGGTFLSDAVLRAFEQEIGRDVIRPAYSAVMGAYGAALYSMERGTSGEKSTIIGKDALASFSYTSKPVTCNGCGNHCRLTVNDFGESGRYISGNRCDRPVSAGKESEQYNLFAYKQRLLDKYRNTPRDPSKPTVGIPMGLNMYELLPFWHTFFTEMGFNVDVSPLSTHDLYISGQHTIPSDTICYPAKLMHGHIEALLRRKPDAIFYPDMSYNIDEGLGSNHFNCPVVAYYPQVIKVNVSELKNTEFICDFLSLSDRKKLPKRIKHIIAEHFPDIPLGRVGEAVHAAYAEYDAYMAAVAAKGREYIAIALEKGIPAIILAGRPYHIDPEISHGIDELICRLGAAVITEDAVSGLIDKFPTNVMNQWTYHARLYAAAKYTAEAPAGVNFVQLVSFGCGVDAITSDECRSIIEESGKIYTQLKIDEISNTASVRIRMRSLFSALESKKNAAK